jgi:hypothetical protein
VLSATNIEPTFVGEHVIGGGYEPPGEKLRITFVEQAWHGKRIPERERLRYAGVASRESSSGGQAQLQAVEPWKGNTEREQFDPDEPKPDLEKQQAIKTD